MKIEITRNEANLIEWCLEQMSSDLEESADDFADYKSIIAKLSPLNYPAKEVSHGRLGKDMDLL
tara:strand:+ start:1758 stop:1949 length:192 start_codon:yes stop_codon:yes gene_type:complete